MTRVHRCLAGVLAIAAGACARGGLDAAIAAEARAAGATWLPDSNAFPAAAREARDSVVADLKRGNEVPAEFYAQLESLGDSVDVFHLWHRSALAPSARGVDGNPGGRSRDVLFDRRQHRITRHLMWQ